MQVFLGIVSGQLYPHSMCNSMPTGLYTSRDFNRKTIRSAPGQGKNCRFEKSVMTYFQQTRPDCKIEGFYTRGRQTKIHCFSFEGFCSQCITAFEAIGSFEHFSPCQEFQLWLIEEQFYRGSKKGDLDNFRCSYLREKISVSLKYASMKEEDCTRQAKMSKTISEQGFFTDIHLQLANH